MLYGKLIISFLNKNITIHGITWMKNESVGSSLAGPSMLVDYVAVRCLDDDVNFFVRASQHLQSN